MPCLTPHDWPALAEQSDVAGRRGPIYRALVWVRQSHHRVRQEPLKVLSNLLFVQPNNLYMEGGLFHAGKNRQ